MTPFHTKVRSRIELDLRSYQERVLPEHLQTITTSDRGRDRTSGTDVLVGRPACHAGVLAAGPRDHQTRWLRQESNLQNHLALDQVAFPVCVLNHINGGSRSRTWQSELMRLR